MSQKKKKKKKTNNNKKQKKLQKSWASRSVRTSWVLQRWQGKGGSQTLIHIQYYTENQNVLINKCAPLCVCMCVCVIPVWRRLRKKIPQNYDFFLISNM